MGEATLGRRKAMGIAGAALLARPEAGLRTHAAGAFADAVGVCAHMGSPPYRERADEAMRMAARLGVGHVRDEIRPDNDVATWRRLRGRHGLRWHLLASPATNDVGEAIAFIDALGVDAVSAVEGQNEGDSDWFQAQPAAGGNWAATVAAYQRRLHAAVKARYGDAIPVLSPTVLDYRPEDMALLRDAADDCDAVALHPYAQGNREPETEDGYAGIGWYLHEIRDRFKPGAPAMATEVGYATGNDGVSLAAAAKYAPRTMLHLFDRGIRRSFAYELMDEGGDRADSEQNYGLLWPDATPKPAYEALRRLMAVLADPGPPIHPAPVAARIGDGPPDLRAMAFRKRDGTAVLALWRAARSWDPERRADVAVEAVEVRVAGPAGTRTRWAAVDGADEAWQEGPAGGDGVPVAVGDQVSLVRLG